jgi:hypothetical protein
VNFLQDKTWHFTFEFFFEKTKLNIRYNPCGLLLVGSLNLTASYFDPPPRRAETSDVICIDLGTTYSRVAKHMCTTWEAYSIIKNSKYNY